MLAITGSINKTWRLVRYSVDSLLRTKRIKMFAVTYFAYATLYATRKPFSVVKTDVQYELGISTDWLGAVDTCFLASYAVGQFVIPTLLAQSPGVGASIVLLILYGGSGITSFIFGFVDKPYLFCLLWTLNGFLHASVFPLLVTCLTPCFATHERGKVMGAWTTSQQIGAIAATGMSAWVAAHLGWRASFLIPGLFTACFGVFLAWAMRGTLADGSTAHQSPAIYSESMDEVELIRIHQGFESITIGESGSRMLQSTSAHGPISPEPRDVRPQSPALGNCAGGYVTPVKTQQVHHMDDDTPEAEIILGLGNASSTVETVLAASQTATTYSPAPFNSLKKLSQITDVKSVSCSYFCIKCIRYTLLFWLPYYLASELKYSNEVAGYTSIIFDCGGIIGGIGAGQLADRICKSRRLFVAAISCGFATVSLVLFSLTAARSSSSALIFLGAIGVAIAAADSIIGGSAASDVCERAKCGGSAIGAVSGIINGCGSVGAVLQGYLTSKLTQAVGWPTFYFLLAMVAALGGILLTGPALHEKNALRNASFSHSENAMEVVRKAGLV